MICAAGKSSESSEGLPPSRCAGEYTWLPDFKGTTYFLDENIRLYGFLKFNLFGGDLTF